MGPPGAVLVLDGGVVTGPAGPGVLVTTLPVGSSSCATGGALVLQLSDGGAVAVCNGAVGPPGPPGMGATPADFIQNQSAVAQAASFHINGTAIATQGFFFGGGSGDANNDGNVTIGDAVAISAWLSGGSSFSAVQLAKADVNGDGLVTGADVDLVLELINAGVPNVVQREGRRLADVQASTLTHGGSGDVNGDGAPGSADLILVRNAITGFQTLSDGGVAPVTLTPLQRARADVDGDGHVTTADLSAIQSLALGVTDAAQRARYLNDVVVNNLNGSGGGSGDVNGDGVVSVGDQITLRNYLQGTSELSALQRARADLNGDGRLGPVDLELITQRLLGTSPTLSASKRANDAAFGSNLAGYFVLGKQQAGAPPAGDCTGNAVGAMSLDTQNFRLYVCTSNGWRFSALQ